LYVAAVTIAPLGESSCVRMSSASSTGDQKEQTAGDHVLIPDDLVVDREDVLPDEARRLWMDVIQNRRDTGRSSLLGRALPSFP